MRGSPLLLWQFQGLSTFFSLAIYIVNIYQNLTNLGEYRRTPAQDERGCVWCAGPETRKALKHTMVFRFFPRYEVWTFLLG